MLAALGTMVLGGHFLIAAIVAIVVWRVMTHYARAGEPQPAVLVDEGTTRIDDDVSADRSSFAARVQSALHTPAAAMQRLGEAMGSVIDLEPTERNRLLIAIAWCFTAGMDLIGSAYFAAVSMKESGGDAPVGFLFVLLSIGMSLLSLAVAQCIYVCQNFNHVRGASVIGLLPVSFGAFLRIPLSVITLLWLHAPSVKAAFATTSWSETDLGRWGKSRLSHFLWFFGGKSQIADAHQPRNEADGVVRPEDATQPATEDALSPETVKGLLARQRTVTLSFVLFFIAVADFVLGAYFLADYKHAMGDPPELVAIMIGILSFVMGFHSFLLSHSLYVKENFDLVRRGCLIGMLPLSPMVIFRVPVLLATIYWLERDEVKSSFSNKSYPETILGQVDTSLGGVFSRLAPMRVLGTLFQVFAWTVFVLVGLLLPYMYFYFIPSGPVEYTLFDATAQQVQTKANPQATLDIAVIGGGPMSGIVNVPEVPFLNQVRIESTAPDKSVTAYTVLLLPQPIVRTSLGGQFNLDRETCRKMLRLTDNNATESSAATENLLKALISLNQDARTAEAWRSIPAPVAEDLGSQASRRLTAFVNFMKHGPYQWTTELGMSRYTPLARRLDSNLFESIDRGASHFGGKFTEVALASTMVGTVALIALGAIFILYRRHLRPIRLPKAS